MSSSFDFKAAKQYNPGAFETFDNNLGDMLVDLLNGDESVLNLPEVQSLGADNIKAALQWLQTADINGDYKDLLANEGWRLMYRRKPPTPEEFLTWEFIGQQSEGLWPNVRKAFVEFMDLNPLNPKRGLALSTSIGWGKSLLTNLCMAYEIALFSMMREPFKILGHSQPVYEKVKLPNGKYTTIGDLKIGMKIAGVTCKESEVLDIIEQGQKDTYELEFENGLSCRCSMDHLWTVFDSKEDKYVVLPLKSIIEDQERYCFPEEEDCIKDRAKILEAEITFSGA